MEANITSIGSLAEYLISQLSNVLYTCFDIGDKSYEESEAIPTKILTDLYECMLRPGVKQKFNKGVVDRLINQLEGKLEARKDSIHAYFCNSETIPDELKYEFYAKIKDLSKRENEALEFLKNLKFFPKDPDFAAKLKILFTFTNIIKEANINEVSKSPDLPK